MKLLFAGNTELLDQMRDYLARWEYEVLEASDISQAKTVLAQSEPPRIAFLEVSASQDLEEFCRSVRSGGQDRYLYLIVTADPSQRDAAVRALQAGADDFILKPYHREDVDVRLRAARRILDLMTEVTATHELLRLRTTHDVLTGVRNRPALLQELRRALAHAKREARSVSVVMADIDNLKAVNDRHGHLAGDRAICQTVKVMEQTLRPYDTLGRYGSDEFLLVVPGCNEDNAKNLAERIRKGVLKSEAGDTGISLSLGVSTWNPGDSPDIDALIAAADSAVFEAKRQGRNRTVQMAPRSQPVKKVS